jgi:hypothetical protein
MAGAVEAAVVTVAVVAAAAMAAVATRINDCLGPCGWAESPDPARPGAWRTATGRHQGEPTAGSTCRSHAG